MSNFASLRNVLQVGDVLVGGLETIERLTHIGGDKADAALTAIRSSLQALQHAMDLKVSPQAALAHIEQLHNAVATSDAAAIAELHARFVKS